VSATRSVAVPVTTSRFGALDGLRACAAIAVVVSHVVPRTPAGVWLQNPAVHLGNAGVAVFFVLSGFLLYRPFVAAHLNGSAPRPWTVYARHRVLRIIPAYWVALLGATVLVGGPEGYGLRDAFADLTLTNLYRDVPFFANTKLNISWSLSVELAFYLIVPFIALAVRTVLVRRASSLRGRLHAELGGVAALLMVMVLWRVGIRDHMTSLRSFDTWLPSMFDWFGAGMLMAIAVVWRDVGGRLPVWLTGLAGRWWVCWTGAIWSFAVFSVTRDAAGYPPGTFAVADIREYSARVTFIGITAALLVLPAVLGSRGTSRIDRVLRHRIPVYLGTISYGIYLWHVVVLDRLQETDVEWSLWSLLIVDLAVSVAIALLSWHLIERPILRFKDPRRLREAAPADGRPPEAAATDAQRQPPVPTG
jgi:peptidoglycan/LPS O-acetylase OafA/YrhL